MASRTPDSRAILLRVLDEHSDHSKWLGQPFGKIKQLSNSKVGSVGQRFVESLCDEIGFQYELPGRNQSPWDIRIEQASFEVKTATEDVSGSFQFNHIRYHRPYDAVLCVGIAPDEILMACWPKSDIATGKAGKLVSMDKGSSATHKLTKRKDALLPISEFESEILALAAKLELEK